MKKYTICLWMFLLLFFSCTSEEISYRTAELQEDEYGRIIFETFNYKEPIGTFHLYMKTDYAIRIKTFNKNIFDKWFDRWTIEYILYDAQDKVKYVTNDIHFLNDIMQNEIPQGIKLYEYDINTTSWLPNNGYGETIKIIKEICKTNNIEFINRMGDLNPIMDDIPDDYVNTFWCIHCLTFIP